MPKLPPRALHDPVLCLAPTLFRSVPRGRRDNPLELAYAHGADRYLFHAPSLLGCDDLRVLQGLVALANQASRCIAPRSSPGALALREDLHLAGTAANEEVVLVETSLASLAASAGYGGGRGGAMGSHLRGSLERLACTTVEFTSAKGDGAWRILAWDECGTGRNKLRVALNPRLGHCAKAEPRFAQIEMDEARRLHGDVARLLHQRLSSWIDLSRGGAEKTGQRVRFSSLMNYPWDGNVDAVPSPEAIRQRRSNLRVALRELERVGWRIREIEPSSDILEITRPSSRNVRLVAA